MSKTTKIYIAGHNGMVGSAIWRKLSKEGYTRLIGLSSSQLDLRNQNKVAEFVASEKPEVVIDAAARVGGILANSQYPYTFLMDNLLIQNNLISSSLKNNVNKFIFLGSSCIYPKLAPQPLKEEYLLTGDLEPTNEWYAIAKIAGVKAIEAIRQQYQLDYISLMPTNLYGPNDNFDLQMSHVLPALIRKFHDAKVEGSEHVTLWGSGTPLREFLHVDDLADAVLFALSNNLDDHLYNVGSGFELSIKMLAELVKNVINYQGRIVWDSSKPDGTPRKLLDTGKLNEAGWRAQTPLLDGVQSTYLWYLKHQNNVKEPLFSSHF